jgi:hypothetical protein
VGSLAYFAISIIAFVIIAVIIVKARMKWEQTEGKISWHFLSALISFPLLLSTVLPLVIIAQYRKNRQQNLDLISSGATQAALEQSLAEALADYENLNIELNNAYATQTALENTIATMQSKIDSQTMQLSTITSGIQSTGIEFFQYYYEGLNNATLSDEFKVFWNHLESSFRERVHPNGLSDYENYWRTYKVDYELYECNIDRIEAILYMYPKDNDLWSSVNHTDKIEYTLTINNNKWIIDNGILFSEPKCPVKVERIYPNE